MKRPLVSAILPLLLVAPASFAKSPAALAPSSATVRPNRTMIFVLTGSSKPAGAVKWKICRGSGKQCVTSGNQSLGYVQSAGTDGSGNPQARYDSPFNLPVPPACTLSAEGCDLILKAVTGKKVATARISLNDALELLPPTLANGVEGVAYSGGVAIEYGSGQYPILFEISSGALPPGLALDPQYGSIHGVPEARGTWAFSIRVTDSSIPPRMDSAGAALTIDPGPPTILESSFLPVVVNTACDRGVRAIGGTPPYSWSAAFLPPGLVMDPVSGRVTGTAPGTAQNFQTLVSIADASSPPLTATKQVILPVVPPVAFYFSVPPAGFRGEPYIWSINLIGGAGPFSFSVADGSLAPGLSLAAEPWGVVIHGTTDTLGQFDCTLEVTDSSVPPSSGTIDLRFQINERFLVPTVALPAGVRDEPYGAAIPSQGGVLPARWYPFTDLQSLGLSLDTATGIVSGTPTSAGDFGIAFRAIDSSNPNQIVDSYVTLTVSGSVRILPPLLPSAYLGSSYLGPYVQTNGGTPPLTWTIAAGSLPPGVTGTGSAASQGALYLFGGVATAYGDYDFTLRVEDSASPPTFSEMPMHIHVREGYPSIATSELPAGAVGEPYDWHLAATHGEPPYLWSVSGARASLPAGLSLDTVTGRISGIPSVPGTSVIRALVTDSGLPPADVYSDLTIRVNPFAQGRNDSIDTATPVSNVGIVVSFSPLADPPDGSGLGADTDYYALTATGGSIVFVTADPTYSSPADPVLEILDGNGLRFTTCRNLGTDDGLTGAPDPTPDAYDDECVNDDKALGTNPGAALYLQVPGSAVVPVYVHVLDYSGLARPDLAYTLIVNGAN